MNPIFLHHHFLFQIRITFVRPCILLASYPDHSFVMIGLGKRLVYYMTQSYIYTAVIT